MAAHVPSEVLERFRKVPLFSLLSNRGLRTLALAADEMDLREGTVLVREGGMDRDLYVVMRGEAVVTQGEHVITHLGVGDFFGEFALLTREPRVATVTATTDMRVMVLDSLGMHEALRREPVLARRMLAAMATRLRQNERAGFD